MITYEPFAWWHIADVTRLEDALFPASPWSEGQFWAELASEQRMMLVAKAASDVVGYAGINLSDEEPEIMTIAVRPDHQGQGIGAEFMRRMLAAADARAARRVLLEVEVGNASAIALYERFGFVRNGVRRDYYGLGIDAVLMERHV